MATFAYTAVNKEGKRITGTVETHSEEAVAQLLTKQGFRPIIIKEHKASKKVGDIKLPFGNKVKGKDLVIFTRQLSTMINAGVPLVRSLNTLQEQTPSKVFKAQLQAVSKDVESGISLGEALEKHPDTFSPIYVNMVRAGEAGGILDDILKKLAAQQEKDASIRKKVKSASTYPLILVFITIGAFFALTIFVIPKIGSIFTELTDGGGTLPIQTRVMLGISDFMRTKWYILLVVGIILMIAFQRWRKTPKGKHQFDYLLLRTPVLKVVITKVAIARFARIFASLMAAGVSVLETLEVTSKAIGNSVIEKELLNAAKDVKNGKQLSEPLSQSKYFPPIVSQMLAVGEETGQTETVLLKVAEFYEEDVDALVEGLSSIIEPIMIAVMGGMVGIIAASVLGPITSLTQNIK